MTDFGRDNPRQMPGYLFDRALRRDFDTAIRANTDRQNCSIWIDSVPKHCMACRRDRRNLEATRQEYDRTVSDVLERGDIEGQKRLAAVIDQLYELGGELPNRINETRRCRANLIARSGRLSE